MRGYLDEFPTRSLERSVERLQMSYDNIGRLRESEDFNASRALSQLATHSWPLAFFFYAASFLLLAEALRVKWLQERESDRQKLPSPAGRSLAPQHQPSRLHSIMSLELLPRTFRSSTVLVSRKIAGFFARRPQKGNLCVDWTCVSVPATGFVRLCFLSLTSAAMWQTHEHRSPQRDPARGSRLRQRSRTAIYRGTCVGPWKLAQLAGR